MKKVILTFLAVVLVFSFAACSKNPGNPHNPDIKTSETVSESETEVVSNNDSRQKDSKDGMVLERRYKIPGADLYIDVPMIRETEKEEFWMEDELGFTEGYYYRNQQDKVFGWICVTYDKENSYNNLVTADVELRKSMFDSMSNNYLKQFNKENNEIKNINGTEMYFTEGTLTIGQDNQNDTNAFSYTFLYNGVYCQVFGFVTKDGKEDEKYLEIIRSTADAMVQSVRADDPDGKNIGYSVYNYPHEFD